MTSKAIQVSQNCSPKIQYPNKSLTPAKVITRHATNMSAIARETMKRLPILLSDLSVATAMHTNAFPTIDAIIINERKTPEIY